MRITTWNVNGLRAAIRKGFQNHLDQIAPDVLLLQEIRCQPDQLPDEFRQPDGWHVYWNPAERPGYSGTAIWSRQELSDVETGPGHDGRRKDVEGRVIAGNLGSLRIASIYLPSGTSGEQRQQFKDRWLKSFAKWASRQLSGSGIVLGGDFNIAHTELDIFHAKSNVGTSGFLPHERQWITDFLEAGWSDLVRDHFGPIQGPYSWWSNRGQARELDRGWRIDYLFANGAARSGFRSASIHREGGLEVSDHAPVSIDIND